MMPSMDETKREIREEIQRLATAVGNDAALLDDDDLIPAMGLLDSMAMLSLMSWFEKHSELSIPEDEITMDNFGTVNLMATYALDNMGRHILPHDL